MDRSGAGSNRDAAAVEQADSNEVAHGALCGIAFIKLAGEAGDRQGFRMCGQSKTENCPLDLRIFAFTGLGIAAAI